MPSIVQPIRRLRAHGFLPDERPVSVTGLFRQFPPDKPHSLGSLLEKLDEVIAGPLPAGDRTHPLYRWKKPRPQEAQCYQDNLSFKQIAGPLLTPPGVVALPQTVSVKDLLERYKPVEPRTLRTLLFKMRLGLPEGAPHINLQYAHMDPYDVPDPVAKANELFDQRAAAAVYASVSPERGEWSQYVLQEMKFYQDADPMIFYIPRVICLAALAYPDYFPGSPVKDLLELVSQALLASLPGWCGTFGPGADYVWDLLGDLPEGNYDMSQMHLLIMAYRYYDRLSLQAREWLITQLLAAGHIHQVGEGDSVTSGMVPLHWYNAGNIDQFVPALPVPAFVHKRIGESENHELMIHTARYLTNQLLFQRDGDPAHDNRRNGIDIDAGLQHVAIPSCMELVLYLLRNILLDDFSEYNAKSYQEETRYALLDLCSYAYDHEVRLAARLALDYISAHYAVSSNDLRRMVPFRRKNKGVNVTRFEDGAMNIGLVDWQLGADQTVQNFAIQTGNTRSYETPWGGWRVWPWAIASDGGDATIEALTDYRVPPLIHDLFVNDRHRRFFQRLHRTPLPDEDITGRNCENWEINSGSPSYLITAGGTPAPWAIDPRVHGIVVGPDPDQQIGVAVTTSFMPTGQSAGIGAQNTAGELIQFSFFSDSFTFLNVFNKEAIDSGGIGPSIGEVSPAGVANYGVGPDFACGYKLRLPQWAAEATVAHFDYGKFFFVDKGSQGDRPGFYLAFLQDGEFAVMEAFDTWLHPGVSIDEFAKQVWERNKELSDRGLASNKIDTYTTFFGNQISFVIWNANERGAAVCGAGVIHIEYADGDPKDTLKVVGDNTQDFLSGTILNSTGNGVIKISNPFTIQQITLDMSDLRHPKRISETGEVEEAGSNHEVWVDFAYNKGDSEGDFYRPFNTLAAAAAAVAEGGMIRVVPGWTREIPVFPTGKRFKLTAPAGGVHFGVR